MFFRIKNLNLTLMPILIFFMLASFCVTLQTSMSSENDVETKNQRQYYILVSPDELEQLKAQKSETEPTKASTSSNKTPRETFRSFMKAMENYKRGLENNNENLKASIDLAVNKLQLKDIPYLMRQTTGREAAILIKEILDRTYAPKKGEVPNDPTLKEWRIPNTKLKLIKTTDKHGNDQFVFAEKSVLEARDLYLQIKDAPYLEGTTFGAGYKEEWSEVYIPKWLKKDFFSLHLWQWIGLFIILFLGLAFKALGQYILGHIHRFTNKTAFQWDNELLKAIRKPIGLLIATGFWFLSLHLLKMEGTPLLILLFMLKVLLAIGMISLLYRMVEALTNFLSIVADKTDFPLDDQLIPILQRSLKVFIVVFGILVVLQNFGINIMSVMAGLGLGGLAFALAARDTAANIFGSIMILIDRPFKVGDWIIAGKSEGTVEEIGLRSTLIRTFYNSLISVPNNLLANIDIDNMGRRKFRRVRNVIGITYSTPAEKIEAFLEGVKNIILANEYTRKDYFHVVLNNFGPHSLDILLYFFLKVPNWSYELVEKQKIFIEIIRLSEQLGIQFAFPTQTLHISSMPKETDSSQQDQSININQLKEQAKNFGPFGQTARPKGLGIFKPPYEES